MINVLTEIYKHMFCGGNDFKVAPYFFKKLLKATIIKRLSQLADA